MRDGGERGFDGLLQRALRAERASSENTRSPGELCGAWRLQEVIGVGGMGEVWLATRADGLYQAKAAVRFLRTDGDAERFEARFAQERALLARLNHPGIARLIDAGRLFGQPFLVLEYVDGKPLLNYVAEQAVTVQSRIEADSRNRRGGFICPLATGCAPRPEAVQRAGNTGRPRQAAGLWGGWAAGRFRP